MPSFQTLLQKLMNLGFQGVGGGDLSGVDPTSIMAQMQNMFNLPEGTLTPQMFSGFNQGQIDKASISGWSDVIQSGQRSNIGKLTSSFHGKPMKQAHGNFASTGNVNIAQGQARDLYNRSMSDVLAQAYTGKGQVLSGMQEQMGDWYNLAQQMAPT